MRIRTALASALVLCSVLFLAACGGGDDNGTGSGPLIARTGGSGSAFFSGAMQSLSFADSVTVAVRSATQTNLQFTLYTFFGLTKLTLNEVPTAVLVTTINGRDPNVSSSIELPSSVAGMVLHYGFNTAAVAGNTILAQDAQRTYEQVATGALVLEPLRSATGGFIGQASPDRQARYANVTLVDTATSDEALLNGTVPYALSTDVGSKFLGYIGNLGLLAPSDPGTGGPPPPPGGGSGGTGGPPPPPLGGGGGDDGPPAPPL